MKKSINPFRISLFISVCITAVLISCAEQKQSETKGELLLPDPGVVSYTFRNQFEEDVETTLDVIKEMGFRNIEFSNLFGKTSRDLRALLDERDMVCTSYGVSYDALQNNLAQVAIDAHELGAKHVRLAWIPHDSPFDINDAKRVVADFNAIGKKLYNDGLSFSYHNHGYEFSQYGDGTLFDYIVENTHPDHVSFEMDIIWVVWPGHDPIELLNKYPDRFKLVHMDDYAKGLEGDLTDLERSEKSVPIGQGQMGYHAFLTAAKNSSIEYFYIEDESDDVINRVPQSREYIINLTK